jgi:hypothetical protein
MWETGNPASKHNFLKGRGLVSGAVLGFSTNGEIPGRRDKKEEHARRKALRATYLCAARVVPALSDRMSAERFDVLG